MSITHRQVEAFRVVVRTGTTVEAAARLFTSQPSISRLIAELESTVHLKLFDRVKGRLVLTAEGIAFHGEVERSFAGLQRLSEAAAALVQFRGRELRIGSLPALSHSLLPKVIAGFQSRFSDVRVTLGISESTTIREWVVHQQVDIGYTNDELEPLDCDARLLCRIPAVVVMPRDHRFAKRPFISAADLHGEAFVHLWRGHPARRRIEAILEHARVSVVPKAETPHALSLCALVAEGVGIGLVGPYSLLGAAGFDVEVRPFRPVVEFRILELSRMGKRPDALLGEFAQLVRAELQNAMKTFGPTATPNRYDEEKNPGKKKFKSPNTL